MALGAITQQATGVGGTASSPVDLRDGNGLLMRVVNVVGDSSYPTGGSALSAAALGFPNGVLFGQGEVIASTGAQNAASSFYYNPATGKLQAFTTGATGAFNEVGNGVNLSGLTIQLFVWGY